MEGFKDLVEQTWKNDGIINDCKMVLFKKKLQNLKNLIRSWIGSKRTETFALKKTHHALLSSIDVKLDLGTANEDDFRIRKESLKILGDLERVELADVSQKVKAKWALEGDENSCFFHNSLKKKRRQLAIRGILKDDNWIEDPSIVKSEFVGHFMARFQQSEGIIPVLDSNYISPISYGQRNLLERPFSCDEIKFAVWDCGGEKAPGPDEISFKFFTFFWDLIENDVVNFVHEFFHTSLFPQGCNSSFIALILKVANTKTVSEFRPISLIGCQYKIIGKLLANRIRVVIGDCVNPVQSAFIKGSNILDGPLILNEVISWYRNSKKNLMVFKVDFEKAFDSIRWDYLDLLLEKLGFGCRWRSWIKGCFHSARSSVLVNGSPTDEFELHRGLRQGDPLSPFLFILAMEACLDVSFLFSDYVSIFIKAWLLVLVYRMMRLRINIHKSLVIGIGVSDDEVSYMANIIGCETSKLPLKYLGVPVGCNMSRSSNWNAIIQKFYLKLSSWNARLLSVGGRLTLIRYVLNSLPIYYLSIYQAPSSVRKKLEAMRNSFFIEGFSVASVRGLVDSVMLGNGHDATPWNQYLPIKVNVFVG
nr:putative RNA-directed DNA polymerase, eukaryota, reverse transcriptase zinc-binding domain protein [Tanacetum cinerariifolium]